MTMPPRSSDARQAAGLLGERIAARWLARRGWAVVAHRFRSGHRDLDLVARREGLVAFVEVKARRGLGFGDPIEAVRWRKQRELVRSANVWIARHGRAGDTYRFDVVGVLLPPLPGGGHGRRPGPGSARRGCLPGPVPCLNFRPNLRNLFGFFGVSLCAAGHKLAAQVVPGGHSVFTT